MEKKDPKKTTLADICTCGHYKADHDGWGCLRMGCDCEVLHVY